MKKDKMSQYDRYNNSFTVNMQSIVQINKWAELGKVKGISMTEHIQYYYL
jgi:hypothetical protein